MAYADKLLQALDGMTSSEKADVLSIQNKNGNTVLNKMKDEDKIKVLSGMTEADLDRLNYREIMNFDAANTVRDNATTAFNWKTMRHIFASYGYGSRTA